MALWVCAGPEGCGTKYAVGLFKCPRCHNTAFFEDGDPMAKITRHGGASDATLPATPASAAAAETEPTPEAAADQPETEVEPETEAAPEAEALNVTEHLAAPPEPVAEESGEPAPAREPDYETWTVEQLKERLDSRGLPKTGKKDDLVLRLLEDDDTRTAQAEDATE